MNIFTWLKYHRGEAVVVTDSSVGLGRARHITASFRKDLSVLPRFLVIL